MMEEMKQIDDELGIDANFGNTSREEIEFGEWNQQEKENEEDEDDDDIYNDQLLKNGINNNYDNGDINHIQEEDNEIQKELARINRREKIEMGQTIERLRKELDDKDLKVIGCYYYYL
jgi:hypothetical protein